MSNSTQVSGADTSAFAVLAQTVVARTPYPVRVDPRPIRDEAMGFLDSTDFAPVTADELATRSASLRQLGIVEGDAIMPRTCPGVLVPRTSPGDRPGCPSAQQTVAAIGVPRRLTSDTASIALPEAWISRIVMSSIGPAGSNSITSDYLLERSDGGWKFVRRQLVQVIE